MKKCLFILLLSVLLGSSCAIQYKKVNFNSFSPTQTKESKVIVLGHKLSSQLIEKWERKGLSYHHLIIQNSSNDTLLLDEKTLFAMADLEKKTIITNKESIKATKFNKGLFLGIDAFGVISAFSYNSISGLGLNPTVFYFSLPIVIYGMVNTHLAFRSKKRFVIEVNDHYLFGAKIPPREEKEGFVLVKSTTTTTFELRNDTK